MFPILGWLAALALPVLAVGATQAWVQGRARHRILADAWAAWTIPAEVMDAFNQAERARLQEEMRSMALRTAKIAAFLMGCGFGSGALLGLRTGQVGQGALALGALSGIVVGPVLMVVLAAELGLGVQILRLRGRNGEQRVCLSGEGAVWNESRLDGVRGQVTRVAVLGGVLCIGCHWTGTTQVNGTPIPQSGSYVVRVPVPSECTGQADELVGRLHGHFKLDK